MNVSDKDRKLIVRSPGGWLMLALISFLMAWMGWQMIDRYNSLQSALMQLPNPPTITSNLWVPMMLLVVKLSLLMVAFTTGVAIAKERSQQTIWYLLINNDTDLTVVWTKYKAQLLLLGFVFLHVVVMTALLSVGGQMNWWQVTIGLLGVVLSLLWFVALGIWVSSHCQNAGTAVLLNALLFVLLWTLGGSGVGSEYGLNWLALMSPAHHLQWFLNGEVGFSSLLYFGLGAWVFLWLSAKQIKDLRRQL